MRGIKKWYMSIQKLIGNKINIETNHLNHSVPRLSRSIHQDMQLEEPGDYSTGGIVVSVALVVGEGGGLGDIGNPGTHLVGTITSLLSTAHPALDDFEPDAGNVSIALVQVCCC